MFDVIWCTFIYSYNLQMTYLLCKKNDKLGFRVTFSRAL